MGKRRIIAAIAIFLISTILIWYNTFERIKIYDRNITLVENIKANNRLTTGEERLQKLYNISKKNILFIKDLIELDFKTKEPIGSTASKLLQFLEIDENYFQSRFIDTNGMEIIRVENKDDSIIILPNEQLQNKSERYYFKEAIKLNSGDVFVSSLDFNVENGKVEVPYKPTIRFFTPVFDEDELKGIVGLNFNVNNWLKNFNDLEIGLLNADNEVFYNNDEVQFSTVKTDLTKTDDKGHPIYFSKTISFDGAPSWTIYTKHDFETLEHDLKNYRFSVFKTAAILTLGVLLFLIIIYSLYQKNRYITALNETSELRLLERNTLLKEIHHRVKNNLQIITSLLSLQSSFIDDNQVKGLFRYAQYRINSMAIVHEMLYKNSDLSRINYADYLHQLVRTLITSMKGSKNQIELKIDADDLFLNIDTSIPLGLLINEIVTNSLKYGFKNAEGTISIEVKKLNYPNFILNIGDNGIGFPDDKNFRNTVTLGLKLIHKLALQLRGNVEKDNSKKGTHYIITFQEIEQTS